jgi:ABC-type multidrug transport system fused ATPase/permease subunit
MYIYPLLDLFGTMLGLFLFIIWFWLAIVVFSDVFRSQDLGGGAKTLWVALVIVLPFFGVFAYLIARGGKMTERAAMRAQRQQEAFDAYVKEAAGSNTVDQLAQLADLKKTGIISDSEFEAQKERIFAGPPETRERGMRCKHGIESSTGLCEH